ncbi:MAG: diguanylate cyclase, partial [Oscillospiraceae bacterium]|nr:diguanylate cyclase [Oscillospiraceae bacterium]
MKINSHRSTIDSRNRAFAVMIGIAVNILLSLITYGIGLPIYLDAAGTIGVAFIGGLFPGIMTAIATNVICNFFDNTAIYFGIVNA